MEAGAAFMTFAEPAKSSLQGGVYKEAAPAN